MELFLLLLSKLAPLYLIILLGFFAAKFFKVSKDSVATLLIYIISPLVVFQGVYTTPVSFSNLLLPVLFFLVACVLCILFYLLGRGMWQDNTKNILAFSAGTGNTGYFGLPVALALLGPEALGPVVLCTLGVILYENTLGFFMTAKGQYSGRQALGKLFRLPALYAFFIGLAAALLHLKLGQGYIDFAQLFRGAYTVLGMMLIGMGIADLPSFEFDLKFISLTFLAKFLAWPLLMFGLTIMGHNLFSPLTQKVMLLLAITPLAANTVAYAALLKVHPQKAAVAVLFSTLLALFYIPLFVIYFFHL